MGIASCLFIALIYRRWAQWKANAYRRSALRELEQAQSICEISEVLRRTALAVASRQTIAGLSGSAWPAWLASQVSQPMPDQIAKQLEHSVYRPATGPVDLSAVRDYANDWIHQHRSADSTGTSQSTEAR